jgi:regulator of nucleoside diphosphate kinase
MKYDSLILEKKEYVIIKRLLNLLDNYKDDTQKSSLETLSNELETAVINDDVDVPLDVVRLNSEVTISAEDGWKYTFHLVLPTDSNVSQKKVSILLPMGAAVFGYAKGDVIQWKLPKGETNITLVDVKQNNLVTFNIL